MSSEMDPYERMMGNSNSYQDDQDPYDEPSPLRQQHTQFLDLTNGEGGAKGESDFFAQQEQQQVLDDADDDDGEGTDAAPPSSSRRGGGGGSSSRSTIDPSTPGRVVEAGQEHTGRWTREEHEAFLSALRMYGKEWKKVAAKVKTRTVVQTRTHAQKYFQKLQKAMSGNERGEVTSVEMGVVPEAKKASEKKKKKQASSKLQRQQSASSTHAAAHLMAMSTPQQQPTTSACQMPQPSVAQPPVHVGFPAHGFSTYAPSVMFDSWQPKSPGMKIVAPEPDLASKRGRFPEPSPAATGKRKLAEIAAAQMLAGVASSTKKPAPFPALDGDATPPEEGVAMSSLPKIPALTPTAAHSQDSSVLDRLTSRTGLSLQIVNPDTLGITHESRPRRSADGEASPTTPWDGQLEALINESKQKEEQKLLSEPEINEELLSIGIPFLDDGEPQSPRLHPVCEQGSKYRRSRVHQLVCDLDIEALELELAQINPEILQKRDEAGFCPLHSASALSMQRGSVVPEASEITRMLTLAGADVACTDSNGNTALHWAARAGDDSVASLLLMRNCPSDMQNEDGDTALHWAMRTGRKGVLVVRILLENAARVSVLNKEFKLPLDVAAVGFGSDGAVMDAKKGPEKRKANKSEEKQKKMELIAEIRAVRANMISLSTQCQTLVLHHPECLEHIPKAETDWEAPDRVKSIMRRIVPAPGSTETTGVFPHEVMVSTDFEKAKLDLLSRVHSHDYLAFVNDLSKELEKKRQAVAEQEVQGEITPHAVPFTPMVQRGVMKFQDDAAVKQSEHSDTSFSAGSLRAARRAAGAVQHAVDCVLVGRHRNAFCVVRPPGHHAGIKGLLAGGVSCGFCIFNNVAAGALHAISDERDFCRRCAIVDIDVHHGNGTEEIVRKCNDPGKLFFFSIHLYDHDKKRARGPNQHTYSFYPGTGAEDDLAHNIINVPLMPMWREQDRASSAPVPQNTHNTRLKTRQMTASEGSTTSSPRNSQEDPSETNGPSSTRADRSSDTESDTASRRGSGQRNTTPVSSPKYVATGRVAYRRAIQDRLLPALRAFNPDLILISAGFDATKQDVGNARHYIGGQERMGLDLEPEDYAWVTRKILEIADICCQGRVVSVLEGGYGRTPLVASDDRRLDRTLFAESAMRHLHALIDPYDVEARFSS